MIGHFQAVLTHYVSTPRLIKLRFSNIPILIIVGTEDALVNTINSRILHNVLGGTLYIVDNAGHGLTAEHPEQVNNVLHNHINKAIQNNTVGHSNYTAQQHKVLSYACNHLTTHSCTTCTQVFLSNALKGYIIGFVFRLLFNTYFKNQHNNNVHTTVIQQCRQFGMLIASIRSLITATTCTINSIRFKNAIRQVDTLNDVDIVDSNINTRNIILYIIAFIVLIRSAKNVVA